MLELFQKDENGVLYLAGAYDFFVKQKKEYPDEAALSRKKLKEALEDFSEEIRALFPSLYQS